MIDHGGDLATAYGHQSSIAVCVRPAVSQGQVIGYVGSTGHCFGPHLHFEVRVNGNPVDPLGYLYELEAERLRRAGRRSGTTITAATTDGGHGRHPPVDERAHQVAPRA